MSDSNVIKLAQPGAFTDSLTEILRSGARALLTQAVEAEVAEFPAKHADLKTETASSASCAPGKFGFSLACERLAGFAADSLLERAGFELSVPLRATAPAISFPEISNPFSAK